jgi:hypothetical protein
MTTSADESVLAPPKEGIDFDALPWNLNLPEEISYVHLTTTTGAWTKEHYDAPAIQELCLILSTSTVIGRSH